MKKKFNALQKDIEDQRDEIKTLFEHKKELYQVGLGCTLLSACEGFTQYELWVGSPSGSVGSQCEGRRSCGTQAVLRCWLVPLLEGLCSGHCHRASLQIDTSACSAKSVKPPSGGALPGRLQRCAGCSCLWSAERQPA